jgi:DNA-binding MarR family transcriptional regulator
VARRGRRAGLLANFFANRRLFEVVETPLTEEGLGRLHHRIPFFVSRSPGMTVGELMATFGVSHQNIRVAMKQLVDRGVIEARKRPVDCRQRQMFATAYGDRIADEMHAQQSMRLRRAVTAALPADVEGFLRVRDLLLQSADLDAIERAAGGPAERGHPTCRSG